jgi:predicted aconitase with swiveling domain
MEHMIVGRVLVSGDVRGSLLLSDEPLSFWGGYDQHTGEIIDRRHPLSGRNAAGCILAIPSSRGSSTTTAVLLEAIRSGTAPAAILTTGVDSYFALASIVADELFGKSIPVIALEEAVFAALHDGQWLHVREDGTIIADEEALKR